MRRKLGFTLLELMIVVAVIAILASIALTSYQRQIRKSHRSDAFSSISNLQLLEEKWRASNATYAAIGSLGAGLGTSVVSYYTMTITLPPATGACPTVGGVTPAMTTANSFEIKAVGIGDQLKDTGCSAIVLTSRCGNLSKTSTGGDKCWP